MADIAMHNTMANDLYKRFDQAMQSKIDGAYMRLGSQGPDPYFYRIFKARKKTMHIGERLHEENMNKTLQTMITYVKTQQTPQNLGFLLGYIAHFTLDTILHPYVYYHVGLYQYNNPKTHPLRGLHLRFERNIDAHFLKQRYNVMPHKIKLYQEALINKPLDQSVKKLLDDTLKNVHNEEAGGKRYEKSLRTMRLVLKYGIFDRFGLKKRLYGFVDFFQRKRDLYFKDLSFYNYDQSYDYLNLTKTCWHHPITNQRCCDDVLTLYKQALKRAFELIKAVYDHIVHHRPLSVSQLFENRSMNTGLDCKDQSPMKYFNIYTGIRLEKF